MKKKILIVGENKEFGDIQKKLSEAGYITEKVLNAENALDIIEKEEFGIMLSEMNLHDSDGISLTYEIRKRFKSNAIPVIIITDVPKNIAGWSASRAGIFSYFNTPIDFAELMKKIEYALRFSDIFKEGKPKKFPSLRMFKGETGKSISKVVNEVISEKLQEARSNFDGKNISRTIEICTFILGLSKNSEAEKLLRTAIRTKPDERLQQVKEERKADENIKQKTRESWELYVKKDYTDALKICKELLLAEELEEPVRLMNSMLVIEGIEFDTIICPTCKTENSIDVEFCKSCGLSLERAKKFEIETEKEKAERKKKYRVTEQERKNLFGYLSLTFIILGYFFSIKILAPLAIVLGILAFKGGAKKPGGVAVIAGTVIFVMSFFGLQPVYKYMKGYKPPAKPLYELEITENSLASKNGKVVIKYLINEKSLVNLNIFDYTFKKSPKLVRKLIESRQMPHGIYEIEWDGLDDKGKRLSQGYYRVYLLVRFKSDLGTSSIPLRIKED